MHIATNDSINCIIKIIISSSYIIDYQIWYDHQSDDQIHHQKLFIIEVIEIIWLRFSSYSFVVRSQSRVVSSQKSFIHFGINVSITHFSLSVSVTHFFRLYNFIFSLIFSSFFLFFHITSYVKQFSILCFLFLFFFCCLSFASLSQTLNWVQSDYFIFALLSQSLDWVQSDYFIFALLFRILNWFIFCFSLKLLFLRIS